MFLKVENEVKGLRINRTEKCSNQKNTLRTIKRKALWQNHVSKDERDGQATSMKSFVCLFA